MFHKAAITQNEIIESIARGRGDNKKKTEK